MVLYCAWGGNKFIHDGLNFVTHPARRRHVDFRYGERVDDRVESHELFRAMGFLFQSRAKRAHVCRWHDWWHFGYIHLLHTQTLTPTPTLYTHCLSIETRVTLLLCMVYHLYPPKGPCRSKTPSFSGKQAPTKCWCLNDNLILPRGLSFFKSTCCRFEEGEETVFPRKFSFSPIIEPPRLL